MAEKTYRASMKVFWLRVIAYRWLLWLISIGIMAVIDIMKVRKEKLVIGLNDIRLESGVFSTKRRDIPLRMITGVTVNQSPMGRSLNYGDVEIKNAHDSGSIVFRGADRPQEIRENINAALAGVNSR